MTFQEAQVVIRQANVKLLSEFEKASGKISVSCNDCGYQWTATITSLRMYGCNPCGIKRSAKKRRKPIEKIIAELDAVGIDYISGYRGANYPLKVKHRKCGHITDKQLCNVLCRGFRCNTCWRISEEDYHSYAKRHGGTVIEIASSTNRKSKWRCKNGCEFLRSLDEMKTNDRFCNICSRQLSERICKSVFEALFKEPFEKEKIPDLKGLKGGMLEFDLYNDHLKIAVEHHGSHHYRLRNKYDNAGRLSQQKEHDAMKRKYCAKKKITLFEIPELFSMTSLKALPDVIEKKATASGLSLPIDYRSIIAEVDPIGISTSDEIAFEKLRVIAEGSGYKLLDKKFRGGHAKHKFLCNNGHPFSCMSYSFLQGHRCGICYEKRNRQPVFLSDGQAYKSINEAGRAIDVDSGTIHSAIFDKHRVNGLTAIPISLYEFENLNIDPKVKAKLVEKTAEIDENLRASKTAVITSDGRIFPSQLEASETLVNNPTSVGTMIKRKNATIAGLGVNALTQSQYDELLTKPEKIGPLIKELWPYGIEVRSNKKRRMIFSDGRLFESASIAAESLGASSSSISTAIKRKGAEAQLKKVGIQYIDNEIYRQCLSDKSILKKTISELWPSGFDPTSRLSKPVVSDHGDFYKSVKEAAKTAGISAGHMSNSIKSGGKINGKIYRYK